jgi:hypothetical protein
LALLSFPLAAQGTIVTTKVDEDNGTLGGGTGISLREAVTYSTAGDTITFDAALSGQTIRLARGGITIADSLTIDGSALAIRVTLSGDKSGNGRTSDDTNILTISAGTVRLNSLIISGGYKSQGGAITASTLAANITVDTCHFTGNFADVVGGAIYFARSSGSGSPTLTLRDSTFTGNSAASEGGAIYALWPVQIQRSNFTGNTAKVGGAIFMQASSGPTSVFQDSVLDGNSATGPSDHLSSTSNGGAIYLSSGSMLLERSTVAGNTARIHGGGIFHKGNTLTLKRSTVSGNSANSSGGGIFTDRGYTVLENSTIALNTARSRGGGIHFPEVIEVQNCTIAANSAGESGGGIAGNDSRLRNSIVSGNKAPSSPDVLGWVDGYGNLITPILSLAPLGNYGGPTQTMPPIIGSPAIDSRDSVSPLTIDQRGYQRVNRRDIGAVGYQGDRSSDASIIYDIMPLIWNADADGDGLPYAIERLHGTNPFVPDTSSTSTLSTPVHNSEGKPVLTFITSRNTAVPETHTSWCLMRSPDLTPESWREIYRFTPYGASSKPGVSFIITPVDGETERVTVTDGNPLPGGGFYRFEAVLGFK